MSARKRIVTALTEKLKLINGQSPYKSNLYGTNVVSKHMFWDEVNDFPYVCVVAGTETREYLPSDFKWGYLNVALKLYVYGEESHELLENLISDVELVVSENETLDLGEGNATTEILVTSIITDEGLLAPNGVGEVNLQVRYPVLPST